jgi:ComF family protein
MEDNPNNDFEKHFMGRIHIQAGSALFYFTKGGIIQEAIHAMKYKNMPYVGFELGKMLGAKLSTHQVYKTCDAVVGVPLHNRKKRQRGYNQADHIARGVSVSMNIPFLKNVIFRQRMTTSQTRKTRLLRMRNMKEGFGVKYPELIESKHILLVDDVLTSGATLDFCGQAILQQSNSKVSLATLAMGSVV